MRILILSTHAERCGIAAYNDQVVRALRSKAHDVTVFPVARNDMADADENRMREHFAAFVERACQYDRVFIQHEPGFFSGKHATRFSLQLFAEIMDGIRACGTPTTIIFHTEPKNQTGLFSRRRYYWRKIARLANSSDNIAIVMHNQAAVPSFLDAGFDRRKVLVHQIPTDDPTPLSQPDGDGTVNLAMFGFVAQYKGYAEAVAALDLLPDNYRLIIAGGPHPHATNDTTYADIEARNDPRIELTGWLDEENIPKVLARANIVLAPYWEGGPLGSAAAMRGLVYGRPVIVTDTITFRDIQRSSDCFSMVPPRDPAALAREIERLAANTEEMTTLIERGFEHAREHSFSKFVECLLQNQDNVRLRKAR